MSGLMVIPTDAETGQTIIPGNIPTSIWGHPTIGKLYVVCRFAIVLLSVLGIGPHYSLLPCPIVDTCGGPSRFNELAPELNGLVSLL